MTIQNKVEPGLRMNHRLLLLAVAAVAVPTQLLAQERAARDNIDALIEQHAKAQGVPASFVHQVVKRESNYNPKAKGGSALGLMQIKAATARGLGYQGEASGLFDPGVNLRYGIAYLAGAYKAAKGDIARAYSYYNRGYYYAAKRLGIETEVADLDLTPPKSGAAFGSVFERPSDPSVTAANTALAYAPSPTANAVPTERVAVPLPPRRPDFLVAQAGLASPPAIAEAAARLAPAASATPAGAEVNAILTAAADGAISETVAVPLPPRRPSPLLLAAVGRPVIARKPTVPGTVLEASALPPTP